MAQSAKAYEWMASSLLGNFTDVEWENSELGKEVAALYEKVVVGIYDYTTGEELEERKSFWRERLSGVELDFSTIGPQGARAAKSIGVPRALVPSDARMAIPDMSFANAPCRRPLIRMLVRYDGHARIVEDLTAGRRKRYALCNNCPMGPSGPAPEGSKIRMSSRRYQPGPMQ